MDFSRKDIILEKLLNLDKQLEQYGARKKLKSPLSMILIGGAGLIVKYGLARATRDIDIYLADFLLARVSGVRKSAPPWDAFLFRAENKETKEGTP